MAYVYQRSYVVRVDHASINAASTFWDDLNFLREHDIAPILVAPDRESARSLVRRINRSTNNAVCISGADAATLPASGEGIAHVQTALLRTLLRGGFLPVLEPVGFAPLSGEVDVDADDVAAMVAAATEAIRAFFFTGAGGVIDPATSATISELTPAEALALAEDMRVAPEIRTIMRAAAAGVRHGVQAAHIVDGRAAHATIMELLTNNHLGTEVRGALHLGNYRQ
jgi:acetylglutamate kinase